MGRCKEGERGGRFERSEMDGGREGMYSVKEDKA